METEVVVLPIEQVVSDMKAALKQEGDYSLTITGSSMSPLLIPHRDLVILSPLPSVIKRGDILFAKRQSGGYMLHRVTHIHPTTYTLNGDGQEWEEDVLKEDVIAIVSMIQRKGKVFSVSHPVYCCYKWLWPVTKPFRNTLVKIKKKLMK